MPKEKLVCPLASLLRQKVIPSAFALLPKLIERTGVGAMVMGLSLQSILFLQKG